MVKASTDLPILSDSSVALGTPRPLRQLRHAWYTSSFWSICPLGRIPFQTPHRNESITNLFLHQLLLYKYKLLPVQYTSVLYWQQIDVVRLHYYNSFSSFSYSVRFELSMVFLCLIFMPSPERDDLYLQETSCTWPLKY